jgi:hypothetical protein
MSAVVCVHGMAASTSPAPPLIVRKRALQKNVKADS